VGGDQDLGIESRRKDNISVANGDAKEDIEVEKRLEELDAVLERPSFYGDDRNLRLDNGSVNRRFGEGSIHFGLFSESDDISQTSASRYTSAAVNPNPCPLVFEQNACDADIVCAVSHTSWLASCDGISTFGDCCILVLWRPWWLMRSSNTNTEFQ